MRIDMPDIEKEETRPGRDKSTTINASYIASGEYRRKFDQITNNPDVNRLLYHLAKQMLQHRSGTHFEDMYWIDPKKCVVVAEELTSTVEGVVKYSEKLKRELFLYNGLITIHSHPNSFPPSIEDLNSNFSNSYRLGVIACHDGKVFVYNSEEEISRNYYGIKIASYKNSGYNEYEAQIMALTDCSKNFHINFREVVCDEK